MTAGRCGRSLGENHAADRSNNTELQESSSEPSEELSYSILATTVPTTEQSDTKSGIGGGGWEDKESPPLTYLEMLAPGLEVGPPNHRFRLERQLGEGEKSRVWLATELSPQNSIAPRKALKFFASSLRDSPYLADLAKDQADKATQRAELLSFLPLLAIIRAKATLAALLDHPNIAKVYGWRYGEDGWPFVEMEYLSGCNLRDWRNQKKNKELDWVSILPFVRAIATALDHAHQNYRLPHRHLKLENVLITEQGVVKVLDFSLLYQPPRAVARKVQEAKPSSHSVLPAPSYPQPLQQLRFKLDICALAALTYELLTGNPPYRGHNVVKQDLDAIPRIATQPPSLSNTLVKPAELTDQTWRVLLPCLRYQLETCPDSAGDWLERLQAVQNPTPREHRSTGKQGWSILLAVGMALMGLYLVLSALASPLLEALQGLFQHRVQPLQSGKAKPPPVASDEQAFRMNCEPACGHRQDAQAALPQLRAAPAPADSRVFRDQLASGSQGPEMVRIPAGTFTMGSPPTEAGRLRDEALHQVRLGKAFAIGRYEVTFEEYDRFAAATGHSKPADQGWGRGRRPVILVSWQDALDYTDWLSSQTGQRYRLPTEAEWEYAARAGTSTARYWGNNPDQGCDYANAADLKGQTLFTGWTAMQCQDGYIYTAPVGSYQPNAFGLYDMLGNVLEWTCSAYDDAYQGSEQTCASPSVTVPVVARGGSWSDEPDGVRAADRYKLDPQSQEYYLGFRVARDL